MEMSKTDPRLDAAVPIEIEFLADAKRGLNLFLTGMAGTGKSTLLRRLLRAARGELLPFEDPIVESWEWPELRIHVTASTGIAALNIQGSTVHRYAGIGIGPQDAQTPTEFIGNLLDNKTKSLAFACSRIRNTDVLIIDEISMLPGIILDTLDQWFQYVRRDMTPFGGIQMILVGDFLQLPPVKNSMSQLYDFAFRAKAWETGQFRPYNLTKIHRQNEPDFLSCLADIREGRCVGKTAQTLHGRVVHHPASSVVRLMTHNVQVDKWNTYMLSEIEQEPHLYHCREGGDADALVALRRNILAPDLLEVKVGCRVMCLVNLNEPGSTEPLFVNGETGTVRECQDDRILIESDVQGRQLSVGYYIWYYDWDRLRKLGNYYKQQHKIWLAEHPMTSVLESPWTFDPWVRVPLTTDGGPPLTWHSQLPVRLAYAATIHKSQGQTLASAYIDIRAAMEPGQAYTALSRVQTLKGLMLVAYPTGVRYSPEARDFHRQLMGLQPLDLGRALKPTDY